ncbi:MAG: hypothetical protein ABI377_13105 [Devosia sp.]|jgi:hypothetical protein
MKYRTGQPYRICMELLSHPEGDSVISYELVLPINPDGQIDATSWADDPAACPVRRACEGHAEQRGTLARNPTGRWYFDYGTGHDAEDYQGIRDGYETFRSGALVTINENDGKSRTFRVTSMTPADVVA